MIGWPATSAVRERWINEHDGTLRETSVGAGLADLVPVHRDHWHCGRCGCSTDTNSIEFDGQCQGKPRTARRHHRVKGLREAVEVRRDTSVRSAYLCQEHGGSVLRARLHGGPRPNVAAGDVAAERRREARRGVRAGLVNRDKFARRSNSAAIGMRNSRNTILTGLGFLSRLRGGIDAAIELALDRHKVPVEFQIMGFRPAPSGRQRPC